MIGLHGAIHYAGPPVNLSCAIAGFAAVVMVISLPTLLSSMASMAPIDAREEDCGVI